MAYVKERKARTPKVKLAPEPIGITPAEAATRLAHEIEAMRGDSDRIPPQIIDRLDALRRDLTGESSQDSNGNDPEDDDAVDDLGPTTG